MAEHIKLNAITREKAGKGSARATRRQGYVPAVIYGDNKEPVTIAIEKSEVMKVINSGKLFTSLCDITIDKTKHLTLARDLQLHTVKDLPMHLDFLRVTNKTIISVEIPVTFLNEESSKGLEEGGVLNVVRHSVEVRCPANSIPENIEIDLEGTELGDSIKMSDITLPKGVTPTITDRDFTIATIASPAAMQAEETEEDAEGEEGAEAGEGEEAEGASEEAEGGEKEESKDE